eukprot:6437082-Ditylum_brightwellii.AAC.1
MAAIISWEGGWAVSTLDSNVATALGAANLLGNKQPVRRSLTSKQGRPSLSNGRVTEIKVEDDNKEEEKDNGNDPDIELDYAIILAL